MGDFYAEIEVRARFPISDEVFGALADELCALDAADPGVTNADLGANMADGLARFSMTVRTDDPAKAADKALTTVRAVIHAAGGVTPGWENWEAHTVMRIAPAEESDRLYATA
jgi:hypothetical protein